MGIQLLGSSDASVEEVETSMDRWREYVDSYLLNHPTEWMPEVDEERPVFLRRYDFPQSTGYTVIDDRGDTKYRNMTGDETPLAATSNDIGIQISLGTYKLFYEAGTEDVLWRGRTGEEEGRVEERARKRHEERKQSAWLL